MATLTGGTQLCTRKYFNTNLVSYYTNDDKVLTRRDIPAATITGGGYNYVITTSVTDLNQCMKCSDITYTKTEADPTITYYVTFSGPQCQPNTFSRYNIPEGFEQMGGGTYEAYETMTVTAYDTSGNIIDEYEVDVTIFGEVDATSFNILEAGINTLGISTKKSRPLGSLEFGETGIKDIISGVSSGRWKSVSGSNTTNYVTWSDITFEIRY